WASAACGDASHTAQATTITEGAIRIGAAGGSTTILTRRPRCLPVSAVPRGWIDPHQDMTPVLRVITRRELRCTRTASVQCGQLPFDVRVLVRIAHDADLGNRVVVD